MLIKKFTAITLAAAMMTTMFAGCGGTPESPSSAPEQSAPESQAAEPAEKVTLKVSVWDNSSNKCQDVVIDAFEKANPNVDIELIDIPSAEYSNKLSVMLNGGSDLDAFWIKDGDTASAIAKKGQLADMTDFIMKDGVDIGAYKGLAENFIIDGKNYALPFRSDFYVLYFNKDLFDAANVPYPSNDMTWEEFEELAKKMTSGEGATKNYGALFHTWNACVQNWGVADGENTILSTDYSFWKPYYEMVLRMQNDDKTIMDYATMKTANIHYSSPFLSGNVAMMPMGTWFISTLISKKDAGETDVNWGIVRMPHAKDGTAGQAVGSTTPLAINEASKNKETAWEFVKFATSLEGQKLVASTGTMASFNDDETLKIFSDVDGMPDDLGEALHVSSIALDRPIDEKSSEVNKMLDEEHGLIMLGENTIDKGLETMAERSKEIQGK